MDVRAVLADSPLFAEVDPEVVNALADQADVVGLRGGERLFALGEAASAVYVVASGRLRALNEDGSLLGEIGRGEPIGEMGLLTDEPHRATVVAVRDSILLRVEREALVALFAANPVALLQTVRVIVHRLRPTAQEKRRARTRGQRTVAVIPAVPGLDVRPLAQQLVACLSPLGKTALLDPEAVNAALGEGAAAAPFEDGPRNERLMTWLADQERQHRYLVYTCPPTAGPWARRCMRQADRVLMVVPSGAMPMATVMIDELGQSGSLASRDLLVLRPQDADAGNVLGWRARVNAVSHFYVRPGVADDLGLERGPERLLDRADGVHLVERREDVVALAVLLRLADHLGVEVVRDDLRHQRDVAELVGRPRAEDAARLQHAEDVGEKRVLVRHVQQGILGKHHVEAGVAEGKPSRRRLDEINPPREAAPPRTVARRHDHRLLHIEAGRVRGVVALHQVHRNTARSAADVEHGLSHQRHAGQYAVDFLGTAGRQVAFAPQRFEKADRGIVVLGLAHRRFFHPPIPQSAISCGGGQKSRKA